MVLGIAIIGGLIVYMAVNIVLSIFTFAGTIAGGYFGNKIAKHANIKGGKLLFWQIVGCVTGGILGYVVIGIIVVVLIFNIGV